MLIRIKYLIAKLKAHGTFLIQEIQSLTLSDCNRTQTNNHLFRKRTLNHLAKLAFLNDWAVLWLLICTVHLNVFLFCHVCVSEWIQLPLCLKQVGNLKFKWLQRDWHPQPFSSSTNTEPFSQTGQLFQEHIRNF